MTLPKLRRLPLALLVAGLPLAACVDDENLVDPQTPGGDLFDRYVAIGNSITAGYQSGGINDSTQIRAYPVLLAQQAGSAFEVPLLARPGCPPPFAAPFSATRVTTGLPAGAPAPTGSSCALRTGVTTRTPQNLAVPGAVMASALNIDVAANALTTFILGGRTPVQAAQEARPTLVSVWLGNNDALGAAIGGNPALLTPLATYQSGLAGLADSIRAIPTIRDAILIGVVDPNVVPALQPGAYFFVAASSTGGRFGGPSGKPVNANCAPGTPGGSNLVSIQILTDANFPEINCSNEAYIVGDPRRGTFVLTSTEAAAISTRVAELNAALSASAQANNWIYVDPNALLRAASNNLQDATRVRKCQTLPAALATGNPVTIGAAITASCPSPTPSAGFGALFSFDGVHPSTLAHQIIANALIGALNTKYGLSIPTLTV